MVTLLEKSIKNPKPLKIKVKGKIMRDRITQLLVDEKYNFFALTRSGRIFRKRARGHSGSYDLWHEIDVIDEIERDLFPKR